PFFCLRMSGNTERIVRSNPTTFVLKTTLAWSGVNASVTPADAIPALLTSTSTREARTSTSFTARSTSAADVEFDHLDALLAPGLRMFVVLRLRIAHRREHGIARVSQGFSRVAAEASAGASD